MDASCAPDSSWVSGDAPRQGDAPQQADARNIIEALGNLCYLIHVDAENPALVRSYTAQAEERLRALAAVIPASVARSTGKGPRLVSMQPPGQPD
jgi:hypothetical protein